jgi:hypothetical protein
MKIARGRELLTPEQRQAFMQIPEDEWVLGTYYTFSKRDLEIINKRRREENRLGFAVQLAVLRYPGWPYTHIKSIIHFTNIGQALIKAKEEKLDVFEVLESVIEWNSFVSSVEEAQELARPADYDYLDLLQKRFYSLRKYTPTLLRVLEFHSTKANEPLLHVTIYSSYNVIFQTDYFLFESF